MNELILLERKNAIATITLNHPVKHNCLSNQLIQTLTTTLQTLANDSNVHVIVLAATGKSFCAGADLNDMQRMVDYSHAENIADATQLATLFTTLHHMTKPTIAVVQGSVYGGGCGLVCCCDIAIASEQAQFCFSETKLGLAPSLISPYVLEKIGASHWLRYFLTAEMISADTALRIGMIHEITTENELSVMCEVITKHLLRNGPQAMAAVKQLRQQLLKNIYNQENLQYTTELIAKLRTSSEGQEGLQAFLQKRKPKWLQRDNEPS